MRRSGELKNNVILSGYDELKDATKRAAYSEEVANILEKLYSDCLSELKNVRRVDLTSKVEGKEYFAFENDRKISRPINSKLYEPGHETWKSFRSAMPTGDVSGFSEEEIGRMLYTMAISFCACVDMVKDGDQKTPGTYFEYFVAFFFSWRVGKEPKNSIQILSVDGEDTSLSTDCVFNLGPHQRKFHMPVKISTRERSIMLWAHQKLIDGIYGTERFMGTPVILTETKVDTAKREVTEICLPDQWRMYQLYIAKLKRIYYLDVPSAYNNLNSKFPPLSVQPFARFFSEWDKLSPA